MACCPADAPIIILGMHRSGTTMVTQLLERVGLFVGQHVQGDHEATYFLSINDSILRRIGGAWDYPLAIDPLLRCAAARKLTVDAMRVEITSRHLRKFLGKENHKKCTQLAAFEQPWGFKDPRTVFTLPMWLELFPQARIVNVLRNGVDVAASLRTRERDELANRQSNFSERLRRWSPRRSKVDQAAYRGSARCLELCGGFSLWEDYVARAEQHLSEVGNDRLALRYEDFLADPVAGLSELAAFCQLSPGKQMVASAVQAVRPARGHAWRRDPELAAFYDTVRHTPWMHQLGYSELTVPAATERHILATPTAVSA